MKILTLIYIVNASLLILHEIESAYAKEWEILKLPGKITGFLLLHIPILLMLFVGAVGVEKQTSTGNIIAIVTGVGGLMPFLVHKVIVKRQGYFYSKISNCIIYLNILTGVTTVAVVMNLFF